MIARKFLYFILFIIVLTFMVAYGWFKVQSSYEPELNDIEQIYAVQDIFMDEHKSIATIDIDFFYPTISHLDLLKPKEFLKVANWPITASVAASSKQCRDVLAAKVVAGAFFKKEDIWEHYRCGLIKLLPENFFRVPPFVHPTGQSYAYLAYSLNPIFKNKSWLIENMMLFHVRELSELQDIVGRLPSFFHFLSLMNDNNLSFLEKKIEPLIVSSYILFPKQDNPSLLSHEYDVYLLDELEDFLSPTVYNVTLTRRAKICFYTQGQLCWNITPTQLWKHVSFRMIIAVMFLTTVIAILIGFLFRSLKRRVIEDEQRKLALQIIGHELRTPITSMVLQLETLTQKIDQFSDTDQDVIWGLSINIQRLRRLVEMTQNYLLLKSKNNNVLVKANILTSVNEFFEEICQEFPETLFIPLEEDKSFNTDAHWLTICVKNILSNAHSHGQKPVKLFLRFHSESYNWLEIIIQDQGSCDYDSLEEMCQEFVKGKKSHGTGLGLNIVIKVLKAIGGELIFSAHPTTFTLRIKEGHYE